MTTRKSTTITQTPLPGYRPVKQLPPISKQRPDDDKKAKKKKKKKSTWVRRGTEYPGKDFTFAQETAPDAGQSDDQSSRMTSTQESEVRIPQVSKTTELQDYLELGKG